MRSALTPQEAKLWACLKTLRSEGFRFRRQAPFRGYFLDFVCFQYDLVVEADGSGHFDEDQAEHDRVRDAVLKREGFDTLRISNADINTNIDGVVSDIIAALIERQNKLPSPEVGRADSRRPAARRVGDRRDAGNLGERLESLVADSGVSPHPAPACRRESALPTSGEGGS
jgi:very-short-patch-repair endonuclease